eukprot:5267168-Pleurochrysis_carterae.AAC.5
MHRIHPADRSTGPSAEVRARTEPTGRAAGVEQQPRLRQEAASSDCDEDRESNRAKCGEGGGQRTAVAASSSGRRAAPAARSAR